MADDPTKKDPTPEPEPTPEPTPGADPEPEPTPEPEPEPKDKYGQPGINKERHDKEVAELNAKIAELQKQVDEAAETKEGREKLQKELADVKAQMADSNVTHSLEMAGCVNVKMAKAVLADYEGDVARLKADCPYLFESRKQTGSVDGKPGTAPSAADERRKAARKAAGLE